MNDITRRALELYTSGEYSESEVARILSKENDQLVTRSQVHGRLYRLRNTLPECEVVGVTAKDIKVDEARILRRAIEDWEVQRELEERKESQVISFDHGPVAFAFVADAHIGGKGVDYKRLFDEAVIISETPGMHVGFVGDLVDNFVTQKLVTLQKFSRFTVEDEWVLAKRYLEILRPKVICGGNHDFWTEKVSGIPYLREVIEQAMSDAIYDPFQVDITINVGGREYPGRIRHKWRWNSRYNPSWGIENSNRFDQSFVWGVGAHTHISGLIREFTTGGETKIAAVCGAYKRIDDFAISGGYPRANPDTAVVIVFAEEGMVGFSNLRFAVDYMKSVYS